MKILKFLFLSLFMMIFISCGLFFSCTAPANQSYPAKRSKPKNKDALTLYAKTFLGTPYKYGGIDRSGMDCSGFVIRIYGDIFGRRLPHNAKALFKLGKQISKAQLQPGDLLFFRGRQNLQISHVGIFLTGTTFIHATSSKGVILSKLGENYYRKRFAGARRFF